MIEGAVSDTYSAPATAEDDGAAFSVIVSNAVGSVESAAAKLFVMPADVAPSITVQPADQSVTTGQTATFSVTATGSEPLSYQWQRNGAAISGATDSSYTTAAHPARTTAPCSPSSSVTPSAAFPVTRRGSASARPAVAWWRRRITGQPADVSIRAGQVATFTVTASGTAPLVFQWTRNGHNIPGANAASYSTPPVAAADSGALFGVIIANDAGYVTSRGARLTVSGTAPKITTQPADQTVAAGKTATFTVIATGTAPLTYQWQQKRRGHRRSHLRELHHRRTDFGRQRRHVTPSWSAMRQRQRHQPCGASSPSRLAAPRPSITTQPADQTHRARAERHLHCGRHRQRAAVLPVAPQRQRRFPVPPAPATRPPSQSTSDSGATFSVVISNGSGNVTSRAARLTVTAAASAPTITTQPADQSIHAGQTATFTVLATGSAPLSYQWRRNGTDDSRCHQRQLYDPLTEHQ